VIPIVPELPADIRELKARVAAFVEAEVYPLEQRVAEAGRIDPEWASELRRKSWEEGFGMLNMPEEAGGRGLSMLAQVALEEESGKATNGLGFVVVDREEAVDVAGLQSCLRERRDARLGGHVRRFKAGCFADTECRCANNGGFSAREEIAHGWFPVGTKTTKGSSSSRMIFACTSMPMVTSSGVTPSTRLIMRGPSARSMRATL
jgi:alkylation response protein AidB-like acyl-CoA dehydrogenase